MRAEHETANGAGGRPVDGSDDQGATTQDATALVCQALNDLQAGADQLLAGLDSEPLAAAAAIDVAEQLGVLVTRLRAAHTLAIGQARNSGMWALRGFPSATAWLRDSHLLDGGRARALELTSAWLAEHRLTREAYTSGRITADHVSAIQRVTAACPARARAYPLFGEALLEVAANADPLRTLAVLKAWADTLDSSAADKESCRDTDRRSLHLSQVGSGWDLRGWFPAAQGAEIAGILNEIMETKRRESDDAALDPPATRRWTPTLSPWTSAEPPASSHHTCAQLWNCEIAGASCPVAVGLPPGARRTTSNTGPQAEKLHWPTWP